jgi:hypothetical protein
VKRWIPGTMLALVLLLGVSGTALADPEESGPSDNASCMGRGSAFYARAASGQRASVAHLVKEITAESDMPPGARDRVFAQEKEGGSIPGPNCGTRLE